MLYVNLIVFEKALYRFPFHTSLSVHSHNEITEGIKKYIYNYLGVLIVRYLNNLEVSLWSEFDPYNRVWKIHFENERVPFTFTTNEFAFTKFKKRIVYKVRLDGNIHF